jgi:hypothetical protein
MHLAGVPVKRVLVLLVALAASAHADERAASPPGDKKLAEKYFRAGEKAYQAQSFQAAALNFEQAYKSLPIPEIAFSAAQAYRRLYRLEAKVDDCARAVELYKVYLGKVKSGGRVADAADALSEMEHELDKLIKAGAKVSPQLAAEHTQLGISVQLGDAGHGGMHEIEEGGGHATPELVVTLDGKPVEPYAPNNVVPGEHKIHVEAPGYLPVDRTETSIQGTSNMVEVVLAPQPARIAVSTEDAARISVDGRPAGTAPHAALEVPAGKHLVAIVHRGREPFVRELVLTNGQQAALDAPLEKTWRRSMVPPLLVASGLLAAGSVTATLFAFHYNTAAGNDLKAIHAGNASPQTYVDFTNDKSDRDRTRAMAWAGGAGSVGIAAVAVALWYFDNPSAERIAPPRVTNPIGASLLLAPIVGPGAAGAAISGHF